MMLHIGRNISLRSHCRKTPTRTVGCYQFSTDVELPAQADVVVIGGGVAGCSLTYQLSKRGISTVLVERNKITSGTTWHTGGLLWKLSRPSDVDLHLMESSMKIYSNLEQDTGVFPGLIQNGGLFIARTDDRIEEYKRLQSFVHCFDVETHMITPLEAAKISPILDPKAFKAAVYSPGDAHIDPSMLCSSYVKGATNRGAKIIENCSVTDILTEAVGNMRKIKAVQTPHGTIKTKCVVNAAGVWAKNISQMLGLDIPLTPMKHAFVIMESSPEVKDTPSIRDMDGNVYIKVQGDSLYMGGYEQNPIILKEVENDFAFGLYELDKSVFEVHLKRASEVCPIFNKLGIKKDICGPESFTPDHKPLLGEDPNFLGFYYNCGYNSGGMQFSAGCSEQLAMWIATGRPGIHMFNYDIGRFSALQRFDRAWIKETSHEAFVKNYATVYPNDQKLAGRNHKIDMFHEALVARGAVMEQVRGIERPAYFVKDRIVPVRGYDWYGMYDHVINTDRRYQKELEGEYTFGFSAYHHAIGAEAMSIRNGVGLFNLSHFTKMYLTGPDAQKAADWLFTVDTDLGTGRGSYSCLLNKQGGIEADCVVTQLGEGVGTLVGPIMKGKGYYIVACGESGPQAKYHIRKELIRQNFRAIISDTTDKIGLLSLQGPKSGQLLQSMTETPITDDRFPIGMSHLIKIDGHVCRAMRISFVGELGYQLHIPVASCIPIYNRTIDAGRGFDLEHIGFRAFHSLLCEKGYHLWNYDIRSNDNPIEADLKGICRENGQYLGKQHVDKLKQKGCYKRRAFFTLQSDVPLHGMETIWRDDHVVGYLRRGNYGYSLDCSIGIGYVQNPSGKIVDDDFLMRGKYEIEVSDKKYPATLFLKSPFDPTHNRILGEYDFETQEKEHFED